MTKLCPVCKKVQIQDKYAMCASCNIKAKQADNTDNQNECLKEIAEHLKHINWNLGAIKSIMANDVDTFKNIQDEEKNQ